MKWRMQSILTYDHVLGKHFFSYLDDMAANKQMLSNKKAKNLEEEECVLHVPPEKSTRGNQTSNQPCRYVNYDAVRKNSGTLAKFSSKKQ